MGGKGENSDRCTVVVCSCDEYKDTWDPCFKILSHEWPDIKYPITLVTEKLPYQCKYMDVDVCKVGKIMPWGRRMLKCLKKIDTEYIMLLLDDYYPLEKVDQNRIEECLDWMSGDTNVAVFSFNPTPGNNIKDNKYLHFEKRTQDGEYRFNCQPAVWRRERLIEFIRPHETPWQWEVVGNIRSRRYSDDFYSAIEGEPYVFTHLFETYGLRQAKWGVATVDLFKKHDVEMDLTIRGFFDFEEEITKKEIRKR